MIPYIGIPYTNYLRLSVDPMGADYLDYTDYHEHNTNIENDPPVPKKKKSLQSELFQDELNFMYPNSTNSTNSVNSLTRYNEDLEAITSLPILMNPHSDSILGHFVNHVDPFESDTNSFAHYLKKNFKFIIFVCVAVLFLIGFLIFAYNVQRNGSNLNSIPTSMPTSL